MGHAGENDSSAASCPGMDGAKCSLWGARMAEIIQFRPKSELSDEEAEIDLLTAVDVAIRDLREIAARWGEEAARVQAEECRRMLERAFNAVV
jgi:hypothetical protein